MRVSADQSLFAWEDKEVLTESPSRLLSRTPAQFRDSSRLGYSQWRPKNSMEIKRYYEPYWMTNRGIHIKLTLIPQNSDDRTYYALLGYGNTNE